MFAQVFELPEVVAAERLDRVVHNELLPALRNEKGFCGALTLVRRDAGTVLLLVFWETEAEAVRPLVSALVGFLDEAAATGSTSTLSGVWEVGARA